MALATRNKQKAWTICVVVIQRAWTICDVLIQKAWTIRVVLIQRAWTICDVLIQKAWTICVVLIQKASTICDVLIQKAWTICVVFYFSLVQYHGNYCYNTTITAYFGKQINIDYTHSGWAMSHFFSFKSSVEHIMEVFFLGRSAIAMHFLLFWSHKVQLI